MLNLSFSIQNCYRCAKMRARVVVETAHERVLCERAVNDGSLHADAAAVNQPHLSESRGVRLVDVFLDH